MTDHHVPQTGNIVTEGACQPAIKRNSTLVAGHQAQWMAPMTTDDVTQTTKCPWRTPMIFQVTRRATSRARGNRRHPPTLSQRIPRHPLRESMISLFRRFATFMACFATSKKIETLKFVPDRRS